jgi:hypothetical protein
MRKISILSSIASLLLTASAHAGAAVAGPGPEMGTGYVGLAVLAFVVGGYVVVRRLRAHKA